MTTRIKRSLKISLLVLAMIAITMSFFDKKPIHARSITPPPLSRTNAPALGTLPAETNCTGCHTSFALNSGAGKVEILDLPTSYIPGQEYTIRVAVSQTGFTKYGFELTALDSTGNKAGDLANLDTNRTAVNTALFGTAGAQVTRQYIYHALLSLGGTAPNLAERSEWTFKWTAPATRIGKIGFYATGNAANAAAGNQGDYIYSTVATVTPSVATLSGADYNPTTPLAVGSIASAFGVELATVVATATDTDPNIPGVQLPTTLGGTSVKVRDSLGTERPAGLFYVSGPQLNFQIPNGTANGNADVMITNSAGLGSIGKLTIAQVQPGVFTVTSDGKGLPIAQLQRVNGTTVTFEDTFVSTGTNTWASVPIEWKAAGDSLYLLLYTTGVRNRSALSNVSATIGGGTALPALYASAHFTYVGVDQVNILLPRTLATRGDVDVILSVDGKTANTVKINFK